MLNCKFSGDYNSERIFKIGQHLTKLCGEHLGFTFLAHPVYHNCNKSCKEMGGATSMLLVIRDVFSQQAADITQWADTIYWMVRCDWL